ncbi:acyl carrier protein [Methylobacter sp.]|uniref:acyl carrier protein n=1 Tax=Methylobacter sp. TaxID=2051955 RepID=UPI001206BB16|nr:acyl carrier protein [Methylobacter sp.]TAK65180.1 MAG: acyl carrier protein [Methylobacter sp.]
MAVFNDVIEILGSVLQLADAAKKLNDNSPLLGAIPEFDSMAVVSIITALEDRFGFVVDDDEIDAAVFETVGSLVAFVERKLQAS